MRRVSKPVLRIVPATEPSAAEQSLQRLRRSPRPATMLQCQRCAGREVIETRIGVMLNDGKPKGGTKALLCAGCHSRGDRVVLA